MQFISIYFNSIKNDNIVKTIENTGLITVFASYSKHSEIDGLQSPPLRFLS